MQLEQSNAPRAADRRAVPRDAVHPTVSAVNEYVTGGNFEEPIRNNRFLGISGENTDKVTQPLYTKSSLAR